MLSASLDEVLFPPQNGLAKQQNTASFWLSVITIILATAVINAAAFFFFTGPQTIFQAQHDDILRLQRATLDERMSSAFLHEENNIIARQVKRTDELIRNFKTVYNGPDSPRTRLLCRGFASVAELNESEVSEDMGRVDAYEEVGFDWAQGLARAQDRAESAEMETWRAADYFAEARLRYGNSSRQSWDAAQRFQEQAIALVTSNAHMTAYIKFLTPISSLEDAQIDAENDAQDSRVRSLIITMRVSGVVLVGTAGLFLSLGVLFFVRRVARAFERRKKEPN